MLLYYLLLVLCMIASSESQQYASTSILPGPLATPAVKALKTIQNPRDWGYDFDIRSFTSELQKTIMISHPDCKPVAVIDVFEIDDADPTRLDVQIAWNKLQDKRPSHVKLALRDLILGFWAMIGRKPHDLRQIYYHTVLEDGLVALTPKIFDTMNRPLKDITIRQEGTNIGEQQAFQLLVSSTAFGNGNQKMVDEYEEMAGMRINSFQYIFYDASDLANLQFDFVVHLELTSSL